MTDKQFKLEKHTYEKVNINSSNKDLFEVFPSINNTRDRLSQSIIIFINLLLRKI